MWNEARWLPPGLVLGDYTKAGCGVSVNNGDVTLAQAFRWLRDPSAQRSRRSAVDTPSRKGAHLARAWPAR